MISITEVERLQKLLIDKFGGSHAIRDKAALESALARPFQTLTMLVYINLQSKRLLP
ncbi:MAG TPA: hypothetical protein VKT28_09940 [Puia sp.]|nr:hypothetical protein [Puia sp.]